MVRRNGQAMAEYALVVAGIVLAVSLMMTYVGRSMKGRVADAADQFVTSTGGTRLQYEPYYNQSNTNVTQNSTQNETMSAGAAVARTSGQTSTQTGSKSVEGATFLNQDDQWQ